MFDLRDAKFLGSKLDTICRNLDCSAVSASELVPDAHLAAKFGNVQTAKDKMQMIKMFSHQNGDMKQREAVMWKILWEEWFPVVYLGVITNFPTRSQMEAVGTNIGMSRVAAKMRLHDVALQHGHLTFLHGRHLRQEIGEPFRAALELHHQVAGRAGNKTEMQWAEKILKKL